MKPLPVFLIFAAGVLFGVLGQRTPEPSAVAAPVVVGSPPGELARLTAELAEARERIAVQDELLAAPRSNCQGGLCETCRCPGDGRCKAGVCDATPNVADATRNVACAGGACATYQAQPVRRFRIFGRRR